MTDDVIAKDPRRSLDALLPMARQFVANVEDERSRYLIYPDLRERAAEDGRGEASVRAVAFVTQLSAAMKMIPDDSDHQCEHIIADGLNNDGVTIDFARRTAYCDDEDCPQRGRLTDAGLIVADGLCELGRDGQAEMSIAPKLDRATLRLNVCPTCEENSHWFAAWMAGDSEDGD
jgi:hypothetical protein